MGQSGRPHAKSEGIRTPGPNLKLGGIGLLKVVIGITYGTTIGLLENKLLFWTLEENRRRGRELLHGIGKVFFLRYAIDALALFGFGFAVRDAWAIIAATMSVTIAVKISLFLVYTRKGGRFE
jgi:hypothetical protein